MERKRRSLHDRQRQEIVEKLNRLAKTQATDTNQFDFASHEFFTKRNEVELLPSSFFITEAKEVEKVRLTPQEKDHTGAEMLNLMAASQNHQFKNRRKSYIAHDMKRVMPEITEKVRTQKNLLTLQPLTQRSASKHDFKPLMRDCEDTLDDTEPEAIITYDDCTYEPEFSHMYNQKKKDRLKSMQGRRGTNEPLTQKINDMLKLQRIHMVNND